MGHARTPPKVVRERRRKGIQPMRGKVKRHFPQSHRSDRALEQKAHEAKAWVPSGDPLEATAKRLLDEAIVPEPVREDVAQEIWVQLLEGRSEEAIKESLASVVKQAKDIEGSAARLSLDAPLAESGQGAMTMADMVDTEGRYHRSRPRASPKKPMDRCDCGRPCSQDAVRCRFCVREEALLTIAERELSRELQWAAAEEKRRLRRQRVVQVRMAHAAAMAERRAVYEAQIAVFFTCECGGVKVNRDAKVCRACWLRDSSLRAETRANQSRAMRVAWTGDYGAQRRKELGCEEKVCLQCGYDGPWVNFTKNPNCYGGVQNLCKACNRARTAAYKAQKRAALVEAIENDPQLRIVNGKVLAS